MEKLNASKRIKKSLHIFSICLITALFLWASFTLDETYKSTITYPISFETSFLTGAKIEPSKKSIQVEITDNGISMLKRKYFSSKWAVRLSANRLNLKLHKGKAIFICNNYKGEIARQLKIDEEKLVILTDNIELIWRPFEQKEIRPILNVDLRFKDQYELYANPVIYPKTVTVYGTEKALKNLKTIETKPFIFSDISHSFYQLLSLKKPENSEIIIPTPSIFVYFPIEKHTEITAEVPILLKTVKNEQVRIFPDKAKITASVALKDFKKITPEMFEIMIDFDNYKLTSNKLHLHLTRFPDFVKILEIEPKSVDYVIIKNKK